MGLTPVCQAQGQCGSGRTPAIFPPRTGSAGFATVSLHSDTGSPESFSGWPFLSPQALHLSRSSCNMNGCPGVPENDLGGI